MIVPTLGYCLAGGPVADMECPDCDNLRCRCEALNSAAARVESSLEIAERTYDVEALERLTTQAYHLSVTHRDARAALATHRDTVHKGAASEFGSRFMAAG